MGIIESAPFQKRRRPAEPSDRGPAATGTPRESTVRSNPGADHGDQDPDRDEQVAAERAASLSRRHFLRGPRRLRRAARVRVAGPPRGCSAGEAAGGAAWRRPRPARRCARRSSTSPTARSRRPGGPKARDRTSSSSRTPRAARSRSRHLVQVLGGLDHRTAEGGPDGAGDHARGNGTFLTGVRLKKSATDIRAGISIDQVHRPPGRPPHAVPLARTGLRQRAARPGPAIPATPAPTSTTSPGARRPRRCRRRPTRGWSSSGSSAPARPASGRRTCKRRGQEQRSILDFVLDDARVDAAAARLPRPGTSSTST